MVGHLSEGAIAVRRCLRAGPEGRSGCGLWGCAGGEGDEELEAKGRKREEEIAGMGVGGKPPGGLPRIITLS